MSRISIANSIGTKFCICSSNINSSTKSSASTTISRIISSRQSDDIMTCIRISMINSLLWIYIPINNRGTICSSIAKIPKICCKRTCSATIRSSCISYCYCLTYTSISGIDSKTSLWWLIYSDRRP